MFSELSGQNLEKIESPDATDIKSMPEQISERKEISTPLPESTEIVTRQQDIAKQDELSKAFRNGEIEPKDTQEKGNFGEIMTDIHMRVSGYERISKDIVAGLKDAGHQGIDGIYYNPEGHPPYVIVDAKFGSAQLSETADGKQMSAEWIDKRLDAAVGKEKADEIRMEKLMNPENVGSFVARVDEAGNVTLDRLDQNANVIEKDVKLNAA